MSILQTIGCLLAIAAPFGLLLVGVGRSSGSSARMGNVVLLRLLIAALVWTTVSMIADYFGAKNHFVLGLGVSVVSLIRFHANRVVGIGVFVIGLCELTCLAVSLLWSPHSITKALLLDNSISIILTGDIAIGYGCLICGAVSFVWGAVADFPPKRLQLSQNKSPFTVETESPDRVIKISKSRSS